jgi:hypothetical protein
MSRHEKEGIEHHSWRPKLSLLSFRKNQKQEEEENRIEEKFIKPNEL